MESVDSMLMDISALRSATGDFAESNKLGEGGFGAVYKVLGNRKHSIILSIESISKSLLVLIRLLDVYRVLYQTAPILQ